MKYMLINDNGTPTMTLTTDSPASHYGIPVVRFELIDHPDCGPADMMPHLEGMSEPVPVAWTVYDWAMMPERTAEERSTAKLFLAQDPDGLQIKEVG